jgi:PIN like domain
LKKRSGTKDGAKKPPEPVFFTDRDLGKRFPERLRDAGLRVVTHHDLFGEAAIADVEWLRLVGRKGLIVISHDESQTRRRDEIEAMMASGVRAFYVVGKAPLAELALEFVALKEQVLELIRRRQEPFIAKVYRQTDVVPRRVKLYRTMPQMLKNRR